MFGIIFPVVYNENALQETIMEPQLYGWQHLTFLALLVVVGGGLIILSHFFIKTEKQKMIFLKCVAAFLFVWIIINRISIAIRFNDPAMFIPNSYCGMTSLVLSIMVLLGNKNNITWGRIHRSSTSQLFLA